VDQLGQCVLGTDGNRERERERETVRDKESIQKKEREGERNLETLTF
jgi:hypothetical protein